MTWYNSAYHYKKALTLDHTKVSGSSDLTSFPILIAQTDTDLKVVGSGGKVQNSSGFDIIFTDSTEATKLDHEIEQYVGTTGEIEMWVRIPTLSHTSDTVIYCYFGNSGISTSQENKTGVWDTSFKGVYHLKESSGTALADSTSNTNGATKNSSSSPAFTSSGEIAGAQSFNGSSDFATIGNSSSLVLSTSGFSISVWAQSATWSTSLQALLAKYTSANNSEYYLAIFNSKARFNIETAAGDKVSNSSTTLTNGAWTHIAGTWTGNSADPSLVYVNGALNTSTEDNTVSNSFSGSTESVMMGARNSGSPNGFFNGTIDEVHVSTVGRSAGWIGTEYTNQSSPSTFYSIGSLTTLSTTPSVYILGNHRSFGRVR